MAFDIDDTFSTDGKITAKAFLSLWRLKEAGFTLVPITGRPAGWCDHIVRFWPVDAIVGENGAFSFFMKDGKRQRLNTPGAAPEHENKIEALWRTLLGQFPDAKMASDQKYREYDLAIDVCEDVPAWDAQSVDRLIDLCEEQGAHVKLSSIHVNAWFGDYSKVDGFEAWTNAGLPGSSLEKFERESWIFIGDSPNDEPMFEAFSNSIGVANITKYLDQLKFSPKWVTAEPSGGGFYEAASRLLASKGIH